MLQLSKLVFIQKCMKNPNKGTGEAFISPEHSTALKAGDYVRRDSNPEQPDQHFGTFLGELCDYCVIAWDLYLSKCPLPRGILWRMMNYVDGCISERKCDRSFRETQAYFGTSKDFDVEATL